MSGSGSAPLRVYPGPFPCASCPLRRPVLQCPALPPRILSSLPGGDAGGGRGAKPQMGSSGQGVLVAQGHHQRDWLNKAVGVLLSDFGQADSSGKCGLAFFCSTFLFCLGN